MAFGGGSLVSTILQKVDTLDERSLDDNVQKLTKKSNQLKSEIFEVLKQDYVDFESYVDSTVSLEQRLQEVTAEYRRLSGRIEQDLKGKILKSSDKRQEIEANCKETEKRIGFLQNLVSVYHDLEASRADLKSDKYTTAADRLNKTAESLSELGKTGCDAKVFRALKSELSQATADLSLKLQEEWSHYVMWSPKAIPENPSLSTVLSVELRVPARSGKAATCFIEVITAMTSLSTEGVWERKVESFGRKLLDVMVKPLVLNPGLKAVRSQEKGVLVVRLAKTDCATPHERMVGLYSSLTTVFTLVKEIVPKAHSEEWMLRVGEVVCADMCDLIIKECLAALIPKSPTELAEYGDITSKTTKFEADLLSLGLVEQDFNQLSEYTQNVNIHFATRKCQDLLVRAQAVLMKPIHDTVSVTNAEVVENLAKLRVVVTPAVQSQEEETAQLQTQSREADLNSLTFAFPPCVISESVREFVELLYETLKECCASSTPSTAIQLFYTARNMVELFCAVLPSHHKLTIAELPRAAAVQHNNCMYLAHHLITLSHQFHTQLPAPLNSEMATFVDQVPIVRQLGEECFLAEMRKQCNSILECLKLFGGFEDVSSDDKCEQVRKGIKQALLHITKLSKVYAEVLPANVHHKSVGALLNALVTDVVNGILALEDIAADDATELHQIVNMILERGPSALSLSSEEMETIATLCKKWWKLKELATVLNAKLLEIVDLWDSGSGPLAQQFTPVELRGLIKAIFQNTERRATALAKITL